MNRRQEWPLLRLGMSRAFRQADDRCFGPKGMCPNMSKQLQRKPTSFSWSHQKITGGRCHTLPVARSFGPCFWITPPKLRPVQGWYEARNGQSPVFNVGSTAMNILSNHMSSYEFIWYHIYIYISIMPAYLSRILVVSLINYIMYIYVYIENIII